MLVGIFFFFQAEDGIRDGHVTGVQTCALPISYVEREMILEDLCGQGAIRVFQFLKDIGRLLMSDPHRAGRIEHGCTDMEIGRASCGKECRSRWWTYHEKKIKRECVECGGG